MQSKKVSFPRWVITGTLDSCPVKVRSNRLQHTKMNTYGTIVSGYLSTLEFQGYVTLVHTVKELNDQQSCWVDKTDGRVYRDIIPGNLLYPEEVLGEIIAGTLIMRENGKEKSIRLSKTTNAEINKIWIYKYFNEPCIEVIDATKLTHIITDNGVITSGFLTLANGCKVTVELVSQDNYRRRRIKSCWYIKGYDKQFDKSISLTNLQNVTLDGDNSITGEYIEPDGSVVFVEKKSKLNNRPQTDNNLESNTNNQPPATAVINTPKVAYKRQKLNNDSKLLENSPNAATVPVTATNVSTINLHAPANNDLIVNDNAIDLDNHDDSPRSVSELAKAFERSFLEETTSGESTNQLVIQLIKTVTNGMKLASQEPTTNPYSLFMPDSHQPIPSQEFLNNAIQQCKLLCRVDDVTYLHAVDDILLSIINNQDFSEKIGDFLTFRDTVCSIIRDLPLDSRYVFDFKK